MYAQRMLAAHVAADRSSKHVLPFQGPMRLRTCATWSSCQRHSGATAEKYLRAWWCIPTQLRGYLILMYGNCTGSSVQTS